MIRGGMGAALATAAPWLTQTSPCNTAQVQRSLAVIVVAIQVPSPESYEKIGEVERDEVHEIKGKAAGDAQCPIGGKSTEDARL